MKTVRWVSLLICCSLLVAFAQKKYVKTYFDTGEIQSEGWMMNKTKLEYWTYYYKNGSPKATGHYTRGKKHGYWRYYGENGKVTLEGHYVHGKKNKWWVYYDQNGKLKNKCQLVDGIKSGYCLVYQKQKLKSAIKYKKGKKVKEWYDFSSFARENSLSDLK
ncbi:MAG: hypothetical protein OIF50_02140 [Flavobacteriaceae bacterium]|nr:hypothetical protein [Flavobacteriaceae bacterium]